MKEGLNLPMIAMNSLPGLGLLIEADQWPNPYIAQRCVDLSRVWSVHLRNERLTDVVRIVARDD
jgi:hypothetical protein